MPIQAALHGQPNPNFNAERRALRSVDAMLGLCQGVIADGVVTESEADCLRQWMSANPDVLSTWPGGILAERLDRIYADGRVDANERQELADLLRRLVGGDLAVLTGTNISSTLPFDDPPPLVSFRDRTFVFTGTFAFAPRKVCQRTVEELGGVCASNITQKTDYLVVGTFASRDWIHTSHGRKIEKALTYRSSGVPIAIVGEDRWAGFLR